ncbi:hypothetical protein SSBR45G_01000 [Bradyrhizobium sp. SSBR45G]|uniref:hypothetical protein n=1 Tax=unclassified Bradyrhizobium TaxID=2631580 RepID=UPI0023429647|nr:MULTISPECIES: hypothetical protein [unclassified Bradyrhizobium]GLH75192.1 hypothetical protein SSBR45G_01000 [Bradyrhizobium sp. SSBR45G]GLH83021.1 hypothetical protein SSBR45R_04810 [Bradyrhizobium sp. SSBR45R]
MDGLDFLGALLSGLLPQPMSHAELAPTGIFKSPLYYTYMAVLLVLFAMIFTPMFIHLPRVVFRADLVALPIVAVVAFFLRRSLKWRYPI